MRMMYQRLWPTLIKPGLVIKEVSHARIHKASATGVSEEFTFHVYTKRNSAYLARICRHWDIPGVYRESHESDKASFVDGNAFFGQTRAYVEDCNNAFRIQRWTLGSKTERNHCTDSTTMVNTGNQRAPIAHGHQKTLSVGHNTHCIEQVPRST